MGTFNNDTDHGHTCPMPTDYLVDGEDPFVAGISFHRFNMIFSGACTVLTILIIFILMALHATHLSKPREQIKIMKISALLPLYSISSWLCLAFPLQAAYIDPWIEVFQSAALGGFFLLMCEFISSDSRTEVDLFFSAFQVPQKEGKKPIGGLPWFRKRWIAIFQYPPIAVLVAICTDITERAGVYCEESNKPYFAHIWLTIIGYFSVSFAIMSILVFYAALKTELKGHSPLMKLMAFKLMVGLAFLEQIIFTILKSTDALKPNSTLTYGDVNFGISNMVVCIQTVLFALFFPFAYSHKPYLLSRQKTAALLAPEECGKYNSLPDETDLLHYQGGPFGIRAWTELLNPVELLSAIKFAFNMATRAKDRHRHMKKAYIENANTSYEMSHEVQHPSNEHLMPGQNMYPGYHAPYDPHDRPLSREQLMDSRNSQMHGTY